MTKRTVADIGFDLGHRLRRRRHEAGLTLALVADLTGVSSSTQSRMELGHGGAVPLRTWVVLSEALGADLFPARADPPSIYPDAIARLVAPAGWSIAGRQDRTIWFDRAMRSIPGMRRVYAPAERAVVRIVQTITDLDAEFARLADSVSVIQAASPDGLSVGGVIVIVRSAANRWRTSTNGGRRSSPVWFRALLTSAPMPPYPGQVWMTPRATQLVPVG